jgi:hypothetical protein
MQIHEYGIPEPSRESLQFAGLYVVGKNFGAPPISFFAGIAGRPDRNQKEILIGVGEKDERAREMPPAGWQISECSPIEGAEGGGIVIVDRELIGFGDVERAGLRRFASEREAVRPVESFRDRNDSVGNTVGIYVRKGDNFPGCRDAYEKIPCGIPRHDAGAPEIPGKD